MARASLPARVLWVAAQQGEPVRATQAEGAHDATRDAGDRTCAAADVYGEGKGRLALSCV
jgi:hypothetical protein